MSEPEATKLAESRPVADPGAEGADEKDGDGGADDAHDEHDLLHERVGGAQAVEGDGGADGDSLRGREEAGDDADGGEDGVEAVDAVDEQKRRGRGAARMKSLETRVVLTGQRSTKTPLMTPRRAMGSR